MPASFFSLEGKGLKLDTEADIEPHLDGLKANDDVEEVAFGNNTLGVGACKALAKVLATKKNLRIARLDDIFTGRLLSEIPEAMDHLVDALLTLPKLSTINLNDNAFGLNLVKPIVRLLESHTPLEHLHLNNNGMGPDAGKLIAEALARLAVKKMAAGAPPLRTVVCGRNRQENDCMAAWAAAYKANNQVTEIRMKQNGTHKDGLHTLLRDGIIHLRELEVFDIQDNTMNQRGSNAFARTVTSLPNLKEVNLDDVTISRKGWRNIMTALSQGKNKKLEVIRAEAGDLDSTSLTQLVAAMEHLPNLRRVAINNNPIYEHDPTLEVLRTKLALHKAQLAPDADDDDENWGLGELDELNGSDSESEEESEKESDAEEVTDVVREAERAAEQSVPPRKDDEVDELSEMLRDKAALNR